MPQLHLPPVVQAVAVLLGVSLAITRLLTASKAFWWVFPEWLQKGLPALLVAVGVLPQALEHAQSWLDVVQALVLSVGAWFTASRGDKRPVEPPKGKGDAQPVAVRDRIRFDDVTPSAPPGAAITNLHRRRSAWRWVPSLGLVALLCATSCARLAKVDWVGQGLQCAESLEPGLVKAVGEVLAGDGNVETELTKLVESGATASAVECAVKQLVDDIGMGPVAARATKQAIRGRAFLAKVQDR
jgi:hypothetical protein